VASVVVPNHEALGPITSMMSELAMPFWFRYAIVFQTSWKRGLSNTVL
jgi:hypothetical protein